MLLANSVMVVRQATPDDLPWIKAMADRHRREISFITRGTLAAGIERNELLVVAYSGFCHFHKRLDNWHTIYEVVSEKPGVGRALLSTIPKPMRLKCPVDLPANGFYAHLGGTIVRIDQGPCRSVNVWEFCQ